MALDWQTIVIPFGAGLDTRTDPRAVQPPALTLASDIQFDEFANVSKRLPYAALPIVDQDGVTITDLRRLAVVEDELLLFTETALYSYSAAESAWIQRDTHLAASIDETSVFARTTEQTLADRAELAGVVVYAWLDAGSATTVYLAARDASSGAVVLSPTSQSNGANTTTRPRLIALDTKILFFAVDSAGDLLVKSLDPLDLSTGAAASWTTVAAINSYYDVCQFETDEVLVAYRLNPTTSYGYAEIDEAGTVLLTGTKARTCDGPIAVANASDGASLIARGNGTAIVGDLLSVVFADVAINVAIGTATGTPVNQLTAAFVTTTARVFWSAEEAAGASTEFVCGSNTITTAGTAGTAATFVRRLGVASQAFAYDGAIYVWLAFAQGSSSSATQLQNTYFLFRADGEIVAVAAPQIAGGFGAVTGWVASVQALSATSYAVGLVERRIVPVGAGDKAYAARSPRDVVVTFDDDSARRMVQLGRTGYCSGGLCRQYDGTSLVELGFPIFPYDLSVIDSGVAGSIGAGTYTWTAILRWTNARGESEVSTTALYFDQAIAASRKASVAISRVPVTSKVNHPACAIYRTTANPVADTPLYLATSNDPSATGDNGYLANDPTTSGSATFTDSLADASLTTRELFPEDGGRLEAIAPPAAAIIAANRDRLYLAGIPNLPYTVAYSQLRGPDEIARFNDALRFEIPPVGGPITALGFVNETLAVFAERAVYAVGGDGFDNAGGGGNYGPTRLLSGDVGAESADAVAQVPQGVLFKTAKGWYLLDQGFGVRYIGAAVSDYDSEAVLSIDVLESQHQIRALTASRLLVWDYLVNQWATWSISGARHSVMWNGVHHYCTSSAVYAQDTAWGSTEATYGLDVQLAPIKFSDLVGYQKVRRIQILGEYRSAHGLRVRLARDQASSYFDDKTFTVSGLTAGDTLERRHVPSIRKSRALAIRLTDTDPGGATDWGESLKLTGIALEVGTLRGTHRNLAAASKQ